MAYHPTITRITCTVRSKVYFIVEEEVYRLLIHTIYLGFNLIQASYPLVQGRRQLFSETHVDRNYDVLGEVGRT